MRLYLLMFLVLSGSLLASACSSSDQTTDGSGMLLQGIEPAEFGLKAFLHEEDGEATVMMSFYSVNNAVRFRQQDGRYTAAGTLDVRFIRENESGSEVRFSEDYTRVTESTSEARGYGRFHKLFSLGEELQPGTYKVEATHTDNIANEMYTLSTQLLVPDPAPTEPQLGRPVLSQSTNETVFSASHEITAAYDDITVHFAASVPSGNDFRVETTLSKIRSDRTPAYLLGIPVRDRSIADRGVNRSNVTELGKKEERLQTGEVNHISHTFSRPENGPVLLEIRIKDRNNQTVAKHEEELLIRSENFPALESVRELAAPLYYLMNDEEYKEMMALEDEGEMRQKWDEFWLRNYGSTGQAQTAITTYYTNVELANVYFSNFKEGWKTDMGKVFILFGQPLEMDRSPNRYIWYYSLDRRDPRYRFVFDRPGAFDRSAPYDHYVLRRARLYEEVEYQRVRDWLNGNLVFRR